MSTETLALLGLSKEELQSRVVDHPDAAERAARELMEWLRPLLVISGDLSKEEARIAAIIRKHFNP